MTPQDQLAAAIARSEQLLNPYADKRSTVQINIFDLGLILQSAHEATKASAGDDVREAVAAVEFCLKTISNPRFSDDKENAIWSAGTSSKPRITAHVLKTLIQAAQRPAAAEVTTPEREKALEDFEYMLNFIALTNMSNGSVMGDFIKPKTIEIIRQALTQGPTEIDAVRLRECMQQTWDSFVVDTRCIPDDFKMRPDVNIVFVAGGWADSVAYMYNSKITGGGTSAPYVRKDLTLSKAERERAISLLYDAERRLYEINPSNYDHDEVCKLNNASIEASSILTAVLEILKGRG